MSIEQLVNLIEAEGDKTFRLEKNGEYWNLYSQGETDDWEGRRKWICSVTSGAAGLIDVLKAFGQAGVDVLVCSA